MRGILDEKIFPTNHDDFITDDPVYHRIRFCDPVWITILYDHDQRK
jgi:hypothetical protein